MKKILFAVLASTFATALMADLVYDYKASIKRIDPVYKARKVKGTLAITESYNVVSDTISGYVVLPKCTACDGTVDDYLDVEGTAYLVRKGDKYSKKAGKPFVLQTDVAAAAAIFGAYVIDGASADGKPQVSIADAKKAWMSMVYTTHVDDRNYEKITSDYILPKYGDKDDKNTAYFGFLGLDNYAGANVWAAGFGTAKILTEREAASLGFCVSTPGSSKSCQYINTITGTLIGDPAYQGACGATPMWNVCYPDNANENQAVISGTWTLKYNKTLSAKTNQKEEILKKLGAENTDVIEASDKP